MRFFFGNKQKIRTTHLSNAFDHNCSFKEIHNRKPPKVVSHQQLRNLRHYYGQLHEKEIFAICEHCNYTWTHNEFVKSYLVNKGQIPCLKEYPDDIKRLKTMCINYQQGQEWTCVPSDVINSSYNIHSHTLSCFGKEIKSSNNTKSNLNLKRKTRNFECRYKYPRMTCENTAIDNVDEDLQQRWYSWRGTFKERFAKEITIKRRKYDQYQNISCPAISLSKLTCNTNIQAILPGAVAQYCLKYTLKDTQEEDTAPYKNVLIATKKIIEKLHETDSAKQKALRNLLAASFAHNKTNIIGTTMASYLTRNNSRFIFSHKTVWIPLRDMASILKGDTINSSIKFNYKTPFFECIALDYICRPNSLEKICAFDFFEQYEVVRTTSKNKDDLKYFNNTYFQHPSYQPRKKSFSQGVQRRNIKRLAKIYQYDFPDTANFNGNILNLSTTISDDTEKYSKNVLLLFLPFRKQTDLKFLDSYTQKLRLIYNQNKLKRKYIDFLQNIVDTKSNSFRIMNVQDRLQRITKPFQFDTTQIPNTTNVLEENISDEENNFVEGLHLDNLINLFSTESTHNNTDSNNIPQELSFSTIKSKGSHHCGSKNIAYIDPSIDIEKTILAKNSIQQQTEISHTTSQSLNQNKQLTQNDIITILLTKTSKRNRTFQTDSNQTLVETYEANGSVCSIINWARQANLDAEQKRAFEIIIGSFVLTFYDEAKRDNNRSAHTRSVFVNEKKIRRISRITTYELKSINSISAWTRRKR